MVTFPYMVTVTSGGPSLTAHTARAVPFGPKFVMNLPDFRLEKHYISQKYWPLARFHPATVNLAFQNTDFPKNSGLRPDLAGLN